MSTWLDMEPRLLARLADRLPALLPAPAVTVCGARDLSGVRENAQVTPAVQLYAGPYRPVEEQDRGSIQLIEQTWIAVVVVRNATDQKTGVATRADAGPICDAVLSALLGWPPGAPFTRLRLSTAPPAQWSAGGFGYYPIAFTTRLTVRGELN